MITILAALGFTFGLMGLAIQLANRINKQKEASSPPARVIPWAGNDLECYLDNAAAARARGDQGNAEDWELMAQEAWEDEAQVFAERIPVADGWGR